MAKPPKRDYVTVTIPHWREVEVPAGMMDVAARRTRHLHGVSMLVTLRELLQSAYLQGINDALDVALTPAGRDALAGSQGIPS